RELASTSKQRDVASVDDERRVGMFLAFALNARWLGNVPAPKLDEVKRSGAHLIVVRGDHPLLAQIAADPDMHEQIAPAPLPGAGSPTQRMRYYSYQGMRVQ